MEVAPILGPFGVAFGAVDMANIRPGDDVAVLGTGP